LLFARDGVQSTDVRMLDGKVQNRLGKLDNAMNDFVGTSPWRSISSDVAKKHREPIVAAVSYVGSNAKSVLPLRSGDFLICDASERAIKQGVTSAEALNRYKRNGVRVFSVEGLHSKVISSKQFSWIGSANASSNSRDKLIEASIRVEGPASRKAFNWALGLATDDAELTVNDIQELKRVPISWEARGGFPSKRLRVPTFPKKLDSLHILEFTKEAHQYVVKIAEKEESEVKKTLKTSGTTLEWFEWELKVNKIKNVKVGDWFIDISHGRLGKPCRVIRVNQNPKFSLVWYERIKTPERQSVKELRECISGLEAGFGSKRITNAKQLDQIRKIYGL
jgi:hypothetical protein